MASVEYDFDTSTGIMAVSIPIFWVELIRQIQALIAPPVSENTRRMKRYRESAVAHRRPGRAINHDCCDSCKEGGDLLCCDRCPAAFHLQCHDPPLDEEDLPMGDWLCHLCRIRVLQSDEDLMSVSSFQSQVSMDRAPSESSMKATGEFATKEDTSVNEVDTVIDDSGNGEDAEASSSVRAACDEDSCCSVEPVCVSDDMIEETPLQTLIRVASMMNPKQFELPKELQCTTFLPGSHFGRTHTGSTKRPQKRENCKTGLKRTIHEMENGLVSLPAKLCFECRKSCRKAPLIQCDYCPLLFHQDCLDPPLTTLPAGRWMCPNHAEHALDRTLLSSVSLTERTKLWNKYCGRVSQDAVKLDFLRKIHRRHPPFRYKIKLPPRNTVQIPQAVRDQYAYRCRLLPAATRPSPSVESQSSLCKEEIVPSVTTADEQDEWLASVVSLQTQIARFLAQRRDSNAEHSHDGNNNSDALRTNYNIDDSLEESVYVKASGNNGWPVDAACGSGVNGDLCIKDESNSSLAAVSKLSESNPQEARFSNGDLSNEHSTYEGLSGSTCQISRVPTSDASETSSSSLTCDATLSKPTRWTRPATNQILNCDGDSSSVSIEKGIPIGESLDADLSQLDDRLVRLLAWQRLQQIMPSSQPPKGNSKAAGITRSTEAVAAMAYSDDDADFTTSKLQLGVVHSRATLTPLNCGGQPCLMPYRVLSIGCGADMDVCLSDYGHCNYCSPKHASIFYDEITKHYELLNYSEHGTMVDNVLYSCDFSEKTSTAASAPTSIVASVRGIIDSGRGKNKNKLWERQTMTSQSGKGWKPCQCKASSSSLITSSGAGWEGTAILHHGSHIKCGCLQFVFSITNSNNLRL